MTTPLQPSPKRQEAARYQKVADELTQAALNEEEQQLKDAQTEVEQKTVPQSTGQSEQTAEETQQQGGDSTGSTFLDQLMGRNGR